MRGLDEEAITDKDRGGGDMAVEGREGSLEERRRPLSPTTSGSGWNGC